MADRSRRSFGAVFARGWTRARGALATTRGRLIAGGTVAAIVIVGCSGAVFATSRADDSRYRTAVAGLGEVAETLALTGQVASADSSTAAFQVSGTVGEVLVALGDAVAAGDTLAALDTTELQAAVTSAEDALAKAQEQLEEDLEAQSSGSSASSAPAPASASAAAAAAAAASSSATGPAAAASSAAAATPSSPVAGAGSGSGSSGTGSDSNSDSSGSGSATTDPAVKAASDAVTAAQQALLAAYDAAQAAQQESTAAVAAAQETCAPFLEATITADGEVVTGGADAAADAADAPEEQDADGSEDAYADGTPADDTPADDTRALLEACQAAISDTLTKQETTSTAQTDLTRTAAALDEAVAALAATLADAASGSDAPASGSTGSSSTGSSSTGSGSTGSGSTGNGSTDNGSTASTTGGTGGGASGISAQSSQTITAETILADRAQIDLAQAELDIAQQNLGFATLTSPIDGTVMSVGISAGDSVSAGSTTAVITVQGDGGYIVQSTVALSKIAKVAVGQAAEVTLPAFAATYAAEVASIGLLNVSETSTPSYTVTIAIDSGDDELRVGATAQADVSLSAATNVLTVPTSAVTVSGNQATVVVLEDGETEAVPVEVGAVGADLTEIVNGLTAGDVVVLADLTASVVSDDDGSTSTGLAGLGGGSQVGPTVGGGFPGGTGGFPGGGTGGFQGGPPTR